MFCSRTTFASFLKSTLHLNRLVPDKPSCRAAGLVFPLPVPSPGAFEPFPLGLSSRTRRRRLHRRLLHVVVMALNFLHNDFVPIPLALLQRPPTQVQVRLTSSVGRLLKAFGASVGEELLVSTGRRNPQLVARLSELISLLTTISPKGCDAREGEKVPTDPSVLPELEPYRPLCASRLKLSGRGQFDARPFLSPNLYMAFCKPDALLHTGVPPTDVFADWTKERPEEVAALAKIWDSKGLLHLRPSNVPASLSHHVSRAFNCYKSPEKDRQIIDRRGRNWCKGRVCGPSAIIPVGPLLCQLEARPSRETVRISITDRRDFYHQFWVPDRRAETNMLGPALPRSMLFGTAALERFEAQRPLSWGKRLREVRSDFLHEEPAKDRLEPLLFNSDLLVPCFKAIAQGDHIGVELASDAHASLLASHGLLGEGDRLCSNRPFKGSTEAQGLIIDDFFVASVCDASSSSEPACVAKLRLAKEAYALYSLEGSDDKDVWGGDCVRVAGAQLDSSPGTRALGLITLGAPAAKRAALSVISLEVARLAHTTDSLHLCLLGNWTSSLLYRRQLMSVLARSFGLVRAQDLGRIPRVIGLPRSVAQELVLLAILAPLAVSNLGAVLADSLYATDASEQKGAFVSSTAPPFLVRSLWRTGSKKGGYSRIFSREEALLAKHLDPEPYDLRLLQSQTSVSPSRPLAFRFDFIEVFSSSGRLTEALSAKGWVVGPPLDIARSPAYDLQNLRVLDWLLHMLEGRTLRSLALGPPGSTFSCAASPSLRSDAEPRGFSPSEPRTLLGNTLALRALTLVFVALRMGAVALLEQPRKSKMARLSEWKRLLLLGAYEVFLASCSFGSVHLKEFRFLVVNADFSHLQQPCTRNHSHVKIQGKHTAASSVYVPFLADAIAHEFDQALRAQAHVGRCTKPKG